MKKKRTAHAGRTASKGLPNPIDVHVGARIRTRRTILGISQMDLGKRIGLTFQQIQKYEKGSNRVSSSRLFDLARVFDVPLSYFFDENARTLLSIRCRRRTVVWLRRIGGQLRPSGCRALRFFDADRPQLPALVRVIIRQRPMHIARQLLKVSISRRVRVGTGRMGWRSHRYSRVPPMRPNTRRLLQETGSSNKEDSKGGSIWEERSNNYPGGTLTAIERMLCARRRYFPAWQVDIVWRVCTQDCAVLRIGNLRRVRGKSARVFPP
jgi:transcriptional regulator with XRE-family HTH domain